MSAAVVEWAPTVEEGSGEDGDGGGPVPCGDILRAGKLGARRAGRAPCGSPQLGPHSVDNALLDGDVGTMVFKALRRDVATQPLHDA